MTTIQQLVHKPLTTNTQGETYNTAPVLDAIVVIEH